MGDVSANFSRSEFACKDGCGFDAVDVDLLATLEQVRAEFGAAVKINSACRCEEYNRRVGGVADSQHTKGMAADIVVAGVSPRVVRDYLREQVLTKRGGLGVYNTFTHVDVRKVQANWDKTK